MTVLAASGCARPPQPEPPRPHIIFISLDTLRRDAVSVYDADRGVIDLGTFAADALVFERAYVTTPFTLPAHISMFTGLHHVEHGVINKKRTLAPGIGTLTERLSELGYATVGLYSSEWLDPKFGFERGFDHYERVEHRDTYAGRILRRALELIDERSPRDQPLFLFLHFYDVHSDFLRQTGSRLPYFSPAQYRTDMPLDVAKGFCNDRQECATSYLIAADRDGVELSPDELELIRDLYDRCARYLGDVLRSLLDGLRRRGLYDPAMIVVTSDHGEEFREHGRLMHSQVYEESVAVPLLVKLPGQARAGERVEELVTLMDLPTMALSVAGTREDALALPAREAVLFQDKLAKRIWGMRLDEWKLIRDVHSGEAELFRLSTDPTESVDLDSTDPATLDRLTAILEEKTSALHERAARMEAARESPESVLDPGEEERLRALGYVQ